MGNKKDPRYIGVPNINFSIVDGDDKRSKKFKKQRINHGFDDSETWSLDCTIAKFLLPRLERLYDIKYIIYGGQCADHKSRKKALKHMIQAFRIIASESYFLPSKEDQKKIDRGLKKFYKYYGSLWW